ncbi:TonB-dependent receptor plug domain-containing protein [Roseateles puraquae]|uniref:TonB-dependent receptor n=1 Tax=Roseateles puraquae TaxID=431059 RepID=A0A254N6C9_9BURK|nr:TonB-dependent receptor [Roseateles puraquae]MDG0856403.1 TonB-dependent receptor [Roseateles puraquae]OWR02372.1 TonB-dependent receptor [Roseateles puraquae]
MHAIRLLPTALAALSLFSATAALAQDNSLERVTVVGSRKSLPAASSTDTLVPVDIYSMGKVAEGGGQFDLAQSLQYLSPSFNSTRQTGADGADLIDSAALRGLGSDQTLVLVNGKRRHTVALVNLFGARNRGSTGTDMNSLPLLAIDNVQVLRDGAAAQYGSDAIAGVINVQLKKKAGCEAVAGYGQYSAGDGKNWLASAYCGVKIADGTLGITGEWQDRGRSNRADPGSLRTIGDTKVENKTLYLNGEFPVAGADKLYVTAGAQDRDASSAAWARGGVGSDDIPSRNSAAMYPDGFVPYINGKIEDRYLIVGWKSAFAGWDTDLSQTYGSNKLRYDISNTLNASIANKDLLAGGKGISPTNFDAGGFGFSQATTNFDISRFFPDLLGGSNIAFGAEYRKEKYNIVAGEPGSYIDADGVGFGGNAGSQGFPGFQPSDATNKSRNSQALYVDWEANLTPALTVDAAVRAEHYSDFGSATTAKLAGSFKASKEVLLRGAASTGFRAPSLQQLYFSSTFTDFISGKPLDVVLAPNGSKITAAAGVPALKQEKSKNYTLGITVKPSTDTAFTVDLYQINIRDRIVLSGRFDEDNYPALGAILQSLGVGQAQFFVNSINTRTRGLDLTASTRTKLGGGQLNTFLALNVSSTRVTNINAPDKLKGYEDVLLSERERLFIEQGGPRSKATLGFEYSEGAWTGEAKVIHFGSQTQGTFSGPPVPNLHYKPKTSMDLGLSWQATPALKLSVGGNNVFNVKPTRQNPDETDNGFYYDSVQFGLNGASYYARAYYRF